MNSKSSKSSKSLVALATADDVRAWARKRGVQVAEHGRLSAEVIAAFNKAHKRVEYRSTMRQPERIVKVPGRATRNGQTYNVVYTTTYGEIRDWAFRKGYTLGVRGRIPQHVIDAFATREVKPVRKSRKVAA
jgi:hypothetical protein